MLNPFNEATDSTGGQVQCMLFVFHSLLPLHLPTYMFAELWCELIHGLQILWGWIYSTMEQFLILRPRSYLVLFVVLLYPCSLFLIAFCPFLDRFFQRCCQHHWWTYLWPVVDLLQSQERLAQGSTWSLPTPAVPTTQTLLFIPNTIEKAVKTLKCGCVFHYTHAR